MLSLFVVLPVFDAPATSDMPSKTHEPIWNVRFPELLWSIFAVGRLDTQLSCENCWCVNSYSPSDKSGAFFALNFPLTRRGFSFLSVVERSNFYEPSLRLQVYAYVSHSIDILTSFGTRCETGLKMSKVWAVEIPRAYSYLRLQRHLRALNRFAPDIVTDSRKGYSGRRDACTANTWSISLIEFYKFSVKNEGNFVLVT